MTKLSPQTARAFMASVLGAATFSGCSAQSDETSDANDLETEDGDQCPAYRGNVVDCGYSESSFEMPLNAKGSSPETEVGGRSVAEAILDHSLLSYAIGRDCCEPPQPSTKDDPDYYRTCERRECTIPEPYDPWIHESPEGVRINVSDAAGVASIEVRCGQIGWQFDYTNHYALVTPDNDRGSWEKASLFNTRYGSENLQTNVAIPSEDPKSPVVMQVVDVLDGRQDGDKFDLLKLSQRKCRE